MTREEAREILTHNWTRVENPNYSESELDEAFFMAIEALNVVEEWQGELVRCKDCKWREHIGCALSIADDSDKPKDNDFCSFGERGDHD